MKRFFNINRAFVAAVAAMGMLATSCQMEEVTPFEGSELGAEVKEFVVETEAGVVDVNAFSNRQYTVRLLNEADWVKFPATASGAEGFKVTYEENTGFQRMAVLQLSIASENHTETVYIKQKGVEEYLALLNNGVAVAGSESALATDNTVSAAFDTNINVSDIDIALAYTVGDGWISDCALAETNELIFAVAANPSETELRKAAITLSYTNGWGEELTAVCYVTQKTALDALGIERSFEEVRAMGAAEPVLIEENIIIEGWVVSDKASGNAGDNTQIGTASIDYSVCEKTVYLESIDGAYGFMLSTTTADENVFNRYDKVKLCLEGTTLRKYTDPERYTISGVTSDMVLSKEVGTKEDLPAKKTTIGALTDADIYTYVELQDCELPIRKGSMTPINEGYANAGGANRIQKYALLLRDKGGDDMYIYTNTTCPYRRVGKRLPYGSGPMSGVIVHELFTRFSYEDNDSGDEDTYGNIGRYQIRHMSYDDFGMAEDFEDSFSELLVEFRYIEDQYPNYMPPTHGNGRLNHTYRNSGNSRIQKCEDYCYLGPVGTSEDYIFGKNGGNVNGLGIILKDGTDWKADDQTINGSEPGKGKVPQAVGAAWRVWFNWNGSESSPYYWYVTISTRGISTDQLSMQVGMLNGYNGTGVNTTFGPRYWAVEWTTKSPTSSSTTDADWTFIEEVSVPDMVLWSPATLLWQCAGYKTMNIKLPTAMLGKSAVYIRIKPVKAVGGTVQGYAIPYTVNKDNPQPWSMMNYLAIRYNKQ